jgi:hypothetical protein
MKRLPRIEAVEAFGVERDDSGILLPIAEATREDTFYVNLHDHYGTVVPVVILRARDWRRVRKALREMQKALGAAEDGGLAVAVTMLRRAMEDLER